MSPPSSPHSPSPASLVAPLQGDNNDSRLETYTSSSLPLPELPCTPPPSSPLQQQQSPAKPPSTSPIQKHTSTPPSAPDILGPLLETDNFDGSSSSLDVDIQTTLRATTTPTPPPVSSKTPNLYINGLPPNFPEDELYALTAPYGQVLSVRTFTRHVGDRTSGYGFVLFDSIESAENCIEGLRQYRNLHPSLSKQIHKIPGTTYAIRSTSTASTSISVPSASDAASCSRLSEQKAANSVQGEDDTFKARMERLHDGTSTNLYIEGLPLSIDEATMAALVSPHAIKSSRFFETKLSYPPRIIAFVRLETRAAAEEIIERLHGRMVRGWNDLGSRISVRFADTAEQRELRRSERIAREGDQSSNKLTIAQAALLNLRGKEYQAQVHDGLRPALSHGTQLFRHPHIHPGNSLLAGGVSPSGLGRGFDSNTLRSGTSSYAHAGESGDYASLAMGDYRPHVLRQLPRQLQNHHSAAFSNRLPVSSVSTPYGAYSQHDAMIPELGFMLDSQRRSGISLATDHPSLGRNISDADYTLQSSIPVPLLGVNQTQAHNGYTPAEELILRAHARMNAMGPRAEISQSRKGPASVRSTAAVDIGVGMRAQRTPASTLVYPQQTRHALSHSPNRPAINSLASMSEDEFHNSTTVHNLRGYPQVAPDSNGRMLCRQEGDINALSHELDSILLLQQQPQTHPLSYDVPVQAQTLPHDQTHAPHIRAATLPQSSKPHSSNNPQRHGHYQHNSMSVIDGRRTRTNFIGTQSQNSTQSYLQTTAQNQKHGQVHSSKQKRSSTQDRYSKTDDVAFNHTKTIHTCSSEHFVNTKDGEQSGDARNYDGPQYGHTQSRLPAKFGGAPDAYEDISVLDNAGSPPLVSPALTYSIRTPASLSPATPFFGSFSHAGESFEGPAVGLEGKGNVDGPGDANVKVVS